MPNLSKNKFIFFFAYILLGSALIFCPANPAKADVWGANILAASLKQVMEEIAYTIKSTILGAMKQAAVETIHTTVNNMMSQGGTRGSLIINNPRDFMFTEPDNMARIYMNDFFKQTWRGRGSSDYVYAGGGSGGIEKNYSAYLAGQATQAISPRQMPPCEISDPSRIFTETNWRMFGSYLNDNCNAYGARQIAVEKFEPLRQELREEARARYSVGRGFRDVEKNGQVVAPGSTIQEMQAQIEDLGNKVIAGANSVPEVVAALVTKFATKTIREGIGYAQRNVQKEINNTIDNVRRDVNQEMNVSGPGSIFKPRY